MAKFISGKSYTQLFVLTIVFSAVVLCINVLAENSIDSSTTELIPAEGFAIGGIGMYGRSPLHTDALEALMISGNWKTPAQGDIITDAEGQERKWNKVTADSNGWFSGSRGDFSGRGGREGYLYIPIESDAERTMILQVMGSSSCYVNGVPRVGNRYQYKEQYESWEPNFDFVKLPVKLSKGTNELLFKCTSRSGGRVKIKLIKPESEILLNVIRATLPDFVIDKPMVSIGAVTVINTADTRQSDLFIEAVWPSGQRNITKLPAIEAMSVRKVPFDLEHKGSFPTKAAKLDVKLSLIRKGKPIDNANITISIKNPTEVQKQTYISAIDGSVQYYALNPALETAGSDEGKALVFSCHGACVEAFNQAGSYSNKTWANIVAGTNRGPFGFDWEDWGRMDAQQVLSIAKEKYQPDPDRVYITGHSMGGHGTWILSSQYADKFAAAAPSAGWISFWSYRGAEKSPNPTTIEKMLTRAETTSDTLTFAKNLRDTGVYIIHGGADDNVPPTESYAMIDNLKTFHKDYVYHEEPGQGHWWDLSDEPGTDCVDWAEMFDFLARHRLPANDAVRKIDFNTSNPGVTAWYSWVGIEAQQKPLEISSVNIQCDPGKRRFVGKTNNIERLSLKFDHLKADGAITVQLDGQTIENISYTEQIWLTNENNKWSVTGEPSKADKGPHRYGPFKEAFNHNMVFVYATNGSEEENAWAINKSRFDAEQWWYQGNGAVDTIADTEFDPAKEKDRGVILYGNSETNLAWSKLLKQSTVQVTRKGVKIGNRQIEGDDLACLFMRPRLDSDIACVAVVSGTGLKGMKLTNRLTYFFAGCNYPDCMVIGPEILTKGADGVRAAGFFGNDWSVENGDFAWYDDPKPSAELPAYIGPDPRPFVMPKGYICQRTETLTIDGKLDEESWQKAKWTDYHVDIEGQMRPVEPKYKTRTKMLWDDDYLYIAAQLDEPHVWGTLTERNSVIFNDNDYEVFIDPDGDSHNYFEFEMNALNTVWNLFLTRPYKNDGQWNVREMPGQKTGVFVKGTLNDPSDTDEYWTVEIAFPWRGMEEYAGTPCPPNAGDQWRLGFSRVEWSHKIVDGKYVRVPSKEERTDDRHEDNWIWSPQGVINMHRPETWGYVQFSDNPAGSEDTFMPDQTAKARYLIHKVHYGQEQYRYKTGRFARTIEELGLGDLNDETLAGPITMRMRRNDYTVTAEVKMKDGSTKKIHVRADAKVWID